MENRLAERMKNGVTVFDGATGTELYKKNFFVNTSYESLCLTHPDAVRAIHTAYRDAGAEVITTNTYGANFNKLNKFGLGDKVAEINRAGVALARKAAGPDL
ncbi:MAG: homocysteine S-methyltransferase family protein, partial [Lentisphaeria bacterium]|nr:homocysteine S-methyltransferase family protein [Lentisphaeria bacterium]